MFELNKVHNIDTIDGLRQLSDESIDCIITSPPYWGLRDYGEETNHVWGGDKDCSHEWGDENTNSLRLQAGNPEFRRPWREQASNETISNGAFCSKCGAWYGSLGLEPTIQLYIEHLRMVFAEVKRVLKKTGTCWVNIGDTYASGGGKANEQSFLRNVGKNRQAQPDSPGKAKLRSKMGKSLCNIPERFTIMMTDELGWIKRNTIIWYKRNAMPASVKDRFTVDFEYFYFFTKSKKYYFEQQFEDYAPASDVRYRQRLRASKTYNSKEPYKSNTPYCNHYKSGQGAVKSRGQHKDHLCVGGYDKRGRNKRCVWDIPTKPFPGAHFAVFPPELVETPILAGCPEGGIVLDPFAGSGTTILKAIQLNRNAIGFELNPEYCDLRKDEIEAMKAQLKLNL